jgi:hypothetical protein
LPISNQVERFAGPKTPARRGRQKTGPPFLLRNSFGVNGWPMRIRSQEIFFEQILEVVYLINSGEKISLFV